MRAVVGHNLPPGPPVAHNTLGCCVWVRRYIGAPNIIEYTPGRRSFIDIRDFPTAADLVARLRQVASDQSLYNVRHTLQLHGRLGCLGCSASFCACDFVADLSSACFVLCRTSSRGSATVCPPSSKQRWTTARTTGSAAFVATCETVSLTKWSATKKLLKSPVFPETPPKNEHYWPVHTDAISLNASFKAPLVALVDVPGPEGGEPCSWDIRSGPGDAWLR